MSASLACPCGTVAAPVVREKPFAGGMHLTAYCSTCGRYLKHVPQEAPWLALVIPDDPKPDAQRSLFGAP